MLWWWALDYAQKGQIIPPYDANDIADAVEWDGDPETVVNAFLDAGFLDQTDHTIIIHDWMEYAGRLIEKRENDRIRKEGKRRAEREKALNGK